MIGQEKQSILKLTELLGYELTKDNLSRVAINCAKLPYDVVYGVPKFDENDEILLDGNGDPTYETQPLFA